MVASLPTGSGLSASSSEGDRDTLARDTQPPPRQSCTDIRPRAAVAKPSGGGDGTIQPGQVENGPGPAATVPQTHRTVDTVAESGARTGSNAVGQPEVAHFSLLGSPATLPI